MEVRSLRLADLDFDRLQIRVVQGKGRKDRYVPLSEHLARGLNAFIKAERPTHYLFGGNAYSIAGSDFDHDGGPICYSQRGVQWAVKEAAKRAGIRKEVSVHTLRHTFATHLLEDGLNIVSVQHLLGHENIETTMLYLHVADCERIKPFSPLDTLFAHCAGQGSNASRP
jgi:site-specific recombinase XerD